MKAVQTLQKKEKNMNNVKIHFFAVFTLVTILLSIIGTITALFSVKIDQYYNPFLVTLPISNFFWLYIALFVELPPKKTQEEIELLNKSYKPYTGPFRKLLKLLYETVKGILLMICFFTAFIYIPISLIIVFKFFEKLP
jgi:hypothetical protein